MRYKGFYIILKVFSTFVIGHIYFDYFLLIILFILIDKKNQVGYYYIF